MVIIYKVFAEFQSQEAADRAAGQIRDRIPDIDRITVRRMQWTHSSKHSDSFGTMNTAADWMFNANNLYQGGSFLPMQTKTDINDAERHYEPSVRQEHIICAEGSRESVEQAAHLLRALGGLRIGINDAPGSYFS